MLKFQVQYQRRAQRQLRKMDRQTSRMIMNWVSRYLVNCINPRQYGKALTGKAKGLWRYRVGAYRLVADIDDNKITILVLNVGHRKEIYRDT